MPFKLITKRDIADMHYRGAEKFGPGYVEEVDKLMSKEYKWSKHLVRVVDSASEYRGLVYPVHKIVYNTGCKEVLYILKIDEAYVSLWAHQCWDLHKPKITWLGKLIIRLKKHL